MAKPLMFLPPILFAGLAAMFYLGMQRDDPNALPSTMIGREAPAMNLVQLGDKGEEYPFALNSSHIWRSP